MKRLLLLLLSCFLLFASKAQQANRQSFNYGEKDYMKRLPNKDASAAFKDSNIVFYNLSLQAREPGVYRLPQDNMPCIVPDSTKTVRMPNAWKGPLKVPYKSSPPQIPNPLSKDEMAK